MSENQHNLFQFLICSFDVTHRHLLQKSTQNKNRERNQDIRTSRLPLAKTVDRDVKLVRQTAANKSKLN
jgi:cell division FtsZ-interacting protein ZapD